ncbi:MAG: NADH:flavin oxidoreductase [Brevinema sp.]
MEGLLLPAKIGNMTVKNRFVRSALWVCLAKEDGFPTSEWKSIYLDLAKGGVGVIQTGYARIREDEAPNPGMIGIYDDKFIAEYHQFVQKIHDLGSKIVLQIAYGGSFTQFHTKKVWSPSGVKTERGIASVAISEAEITELVNDYVQAARRAKESGFDGISIHSGHGYFLSQFLSPKYNKREDKYGGSIENRSRIHQEIIQAIRAEVGRDYPIWMKINSQDFIKEGLSEDDMIKVVQILSSLGLDAVDVSGGDEGSTAVATQNLGPARKQLTDESTQSYFRSTALRLTKETNCPVILSGGNRDFSLMDKLLQQGIGFFSLGRPLTSEPDLINKWQQDRTHKPKCVSCNMCYITVGKRCILNPGTIKE